MAEALLKLLTSAGRAINNPFGVGDYVKPKRGEASRDAVRILGDMKKVGQDLGKTAGRELAKHGK